VLASGVYSGKIDFGQVQGVDAGTLAYANTTSSPKAFFVAVDGATGKVLWALSTDISKDSTAPSLRTRVAVDPSDNNFVLCGSPTALASGLGVTHYAGKGDVLVAKLRAQDGQILWKGQFGSSADESCDAVSADGKGKLYIAGHLAHNSSLDFGNGVPLVGPAGASQQALYVVQLDGATGTVGWTKVFLSQGSTAGSLKPTSLATDGNLVWVGGSFTYTAVFDQTDTLISGSSSGDIDAGISASKFSSAFVAALDATSGTASWSHNWGLRSEVSALALNSSGALLLGGYYASGMAFASNTLIDATGSSSVPFVAKLTGKTGDAQTARGYAASLAGSSAFQTLAVDRTSSTSTRDVPYALGVLDYSIGIDLGPPVGVLPAPDSIVDSGAVSSKATLFLVKFIP
jgi:hypothetical protein